jgi:hypothetical protein
MIRSVWVRRSAGDLTHYFSEFLGRIHTALLCGIEVILQPLAYPSVPTSMRQNPRP